MVPPSKILAMLGCDVIANACRSASEQCWYLLRTHPRLDDFQSDLAVNRFLLQLGHSLENSSLVHRLDNSLALEILPSRSDCGGWVPPMVQFAVRILQIVITIPA